MGNKNGKTFVSMESQAGQIKQFKETISFVSVGCFYKSSGNTLYMTMYGRVSDFQMFKGVLTDTQMEDFTGCREKMEGNLLAWASTGWVTSGSKQTVRLENQDWQFDICKNQKTFCCLFAVLIPFESTAH